MKVKTISPVIVSYVSSKSLFSKIGSKLTDIIELITSRFHRRYDHIRCKKLKRRQWLDSETRIFEANFQILVDYVEHELAWMQLISEGKLTIWKMIFGVSNQQELGLKELEWEIQLGEDSPDQSQSAKVIRDLYLCYMNDRSLRKNFWEDVPHRPLRVEPLENGGSRMIPEDDPEYINSADKAAEMDEQYDREDTEKLKELIDIRHYMWT